MAVHETIEKTARENMIILFVNNANHATDELRKKGTKDTPNAIPVNMMKNVNKYGSEAVIQSEGVKVLLP